MNRFWTLAPNRDQQYTSSVRRHSQLNVKSCVLCVLQIEQIVHLRVYMSFHCLYIIENQVGNFMVIIMLVRL